MKVLERGYGYVYEFRCEECNSVLEADPDEVKTTSFGCDMRRYDCPICNETQYILQSKLHKKFL